jgi:DNA-binding SARP family transcriptional activator
MRLELPDKEFELLLSIASTQSGVNAEKLIDGLWPEADGDAARNAFYVCSHRLRKHLGDPQLIRRVGRGYALHPMAEVDLWSFQAAIDAYNRHRGPEQLEELRRFSSAFHSGSSQRALLGSWFFPYEQMLLQRIREIGPVVSAHLPVGSR